MTLVNARAAFEKAVTDAVQAVDATVLMSISFSQSTLQNQGAASDYYRGVIQCNVYVPRSAGTATMSALSEAVIDGLTSVNASGYTDTFGVSPRVADVVGPTPLEIEDRAHFLGIVSCQFTALA
jgi:hypothetical protein